MNVKVGFIGACFPREQLNLLIEKKIIGDIPASVLGWKFVEGLAKNGFEITVINELKLAPYKQSHVLYEKGCRIDEQNIAVLTYFTFNLKIIYHLVKTFFISKMLKNVKPDVVVVYSLHSPYLKAAVKYAKKNKIKVVCIVPDLPNNMFGNYTGLLKWLKYIDMRRINELTKEIDGFVLLTSYMREKISMCQFAPCTVIEGVADDVEYSYMRRVESKNTKYILYSGSLSSKYGIPEFIEAYERANIDVELWFCGLGDFKDEIIKKSLCNKKIKYLGLKNRDEVRELQVNAALLINPRSRKDAYTRYSFPSKTIEYLDSGTPLMMEHLPGIPEKYYDYIVGVENRWEKALIDFFALSPEKRRQIGDMGRQFIRSEKNISEQGKKLKSLIMQVLKYNGNECEI